MRPEISIENTGGVPRQKFAPPSVPQFENAWEPLTYGIGRPYFPWRAGTRESDVGNIKPGRLSFPSSRKKKKIPDTYFYNMVVWDCGRIRTIDFRHERLMH